MSMAVVARPLRLDWQSENNHSNVAALRTVADLAGRDTWGVDVSSEIAATVNELLTALAAAVCPHRHVE